MAPYSVDVMGLSIIDGALSCSPTPALAPCSDNSIIAALITTNCFFMIILLGSLRLVDVFIRCLKSKEEMLRSDKEERKEEVKIAESRGKNDGLRLLYALYTKRSMRE
jgi:low affinity Fe/Cu permease